MKSVFRQSGVGLIEILVTLVILAIGILGLAGLQSQSLKNNESSLQRSQAVVLSYAAFDMLRVNRAAATNGSYNMSMTCAAPTGNTLVSNDQAYWISTLQSSLGAGTCGSINCQPTGDCTVIIQWNEQRATGGSATQTLTTRSRL